MSKSVFLTTCARCGTHWVGSILRALLGLRYTTEEWTGEGRFVELAARVAEMEAGSPGGRCYIRHQPLDTLIPIRDRLDVVALVRDPRDVLISVGYYYMRKRGTSRERETVRGLGVPDLDHFGPIFKRLLERIHNPTWFDGYLAGRFKVEHSLIRYEDMVRDPVGTVGLALERMGQPLPEERIAQVVQGCSFEHLTGGRHPGDEDRNSHYRKGVAGDWRNYFTQEQNRRYFERYRRYFEAFSYSVEGEPPC